MLLGMPVLYEYNDIYGNLELAKELNLDFIEWNLNFSYCRDILQNQKEYKKILRKYSQQITLHFFDEADFGSYDEVTKAYYKILKRYLKLGRKKIKTVNIHLIEGPVVTISGIKNYIYEKEFDIYIKRLIKNLNKVRNLCEKYNAVLVIENSKTFDYMKKTYEELIKHKFIFNFDIGHDMCCNNILLDFSKTHKMKFKELHIHDSDKIKDHLKIGDGLINIKYFKDLAINSNAYTVLEVKSSNDLRYSVDKYKKL